jgi:hypothetical protein
MESNVLDRPTVSPTREVESTGRNRTGLSPSRIAKFALETL